MQNLQPHFMLSKCTPRIDATFQRQIPRIVFVPFCFCFGASYGRFVPCFVSGCWTGITIHWGASGYTATRTVRRDFWALENEKEESSAVFVCLYI